MFEFDDLKEEFNSAGVKVGNDVLMDFLDEMVSKSLMTA